MTARTRTSVAIGTVLAGLVLAGCANPEALDRTPEDSLARVQGAAAKVTQARSARLSMTITSTFAGESVAASTATTQGVYDYAAHKGQMDSTVKTAGIPFKVSMRTLVIGSTTYIKTPDLPAGEVPEGALPPLAEERHKPWTKLEVPKELAGQSPPGPGLGPVPGDAGGDPTQALSYLQSATSKVDRVGSEQVRGTPTTRYAVVLDAAKIAAQGPAELQGLTEETGLAFPRPADVWIDEQGRLRKIHYAVTIKIPKEMGGSATTMTVDTTLELYDFGVPVKVTPPPANQVEVIRPDQPTR
ncbi:MAG TPA: hypothetical protein VE776_00340 [Actinomycetota bacterium]|jgi:outer membrane murein-binding lipoprotein Lpp|nr:hypothetical protein [Actinomycetota bacterium]